VDGATQLLSTIMSNGWPNGDRFKEVVGGIVAKALESASGSRPRVAIFGEMVALLWADGRERYASDRRPAALVASIEVRS
jgi:hypothetical protein